MSSNHQRNDDTRACDSITDVADLLRLADDGCRNEPDDGDDDEGGDGEALFAAELGGEAGTA